MKIYALIVTYNPDIDILYNQYLSVISQVQNIIYIDNGSFNKDKLDCFFNKIDLNHVEIIENRLNLGLGKAQNQGMSKALSYNATHVLLLDQDSILPPKFIEILLDVEKKATMNGKKVGAIAPVYRNICNSLSPVSPGYRFSGLKIKKVFVPNDFFSVSYCIASGSLIPTSVLKEVGLIDESLFIDGLDLEWCCRAVFSGYDIFMTSKVILEHRIGEENNNKLLSHSPLREYYICRNASLLIKYKHIPFGYKIRKLVYTPARIMSFLFYGSFSRFKMGVKGMFQGLTNTK